MSSDDLKEMWKHVFTTFEQQMVQGSEELNKVLEGDRLSTEFSSLTFKSERSKVRKWRHSESALVVSSGPNMCM